MDPTRRTLPHTGGKQAIQLWPAERRDLEMERAGFRRKGLLASETLAPHPHQIVNRVSDGKELGF
jgi:hypothetical protein